MKETFTVTSIDDNTLLLHNFRGEEYRVRCTDTQVVCSERINGKWIEFARRSDYFDKTFTLERIGVRLCILQSAIINNPLLNN